MRYGTGLPMNGIWKIMNEPTGECDEKRNL